jgi:hypothetical protein
MRGRELRNRRRNEQQQRAAAAAQPGSDEDSEEVWHAATAAVCVLHSPQRMRFAFV